jgi:phosphatidylinositol alpha-1,6-mannosyltransferase
LHPAGGGVAGVARLLWAAMRTRWPDGRLITLLSREGRRNLTSSTGVRLAFGARIAMAQVAGTSEWTLYSHLSLAKAQRYVPSWGRRPYGVFLHGIEAWHPLDSADRRVLAGAALRLANSAYTANRVRQSHPDIGPVVVCPLAVPPRWRQPGAPGLAPTDVDHIGPRAVIVVARMAAAERYKGHDALLDAWPSVIAREPDAQLVMVGGGDDQARLRDKARTLGVERRVVFTGFVDETTLAAIYERAVVFAMPSRGEGFGLAYLEAMDHGLPCIGSIHDAAAEVIEDGVTGFLVDQADRPALADRLAHLVTDADRRRAMGEAGRRRVRERFTADRFSKTLIDAIETAVHGATPAPAWRASRSA